VDVLCVRGMHVSFRCFYRAMLSICGTSHGPVSVHPSQVGVLSKRINESSWFLARELHSTYPTLCYTEIHVPSKIRVTSLWNFAPNSGLRKFRHGISSKHAINLARERWTLRGLKLGCRRSTKFIIPPSSDARPL